MDVEFFYFFFVLVELAFQTSSVLIVKWLYRRRHIELEVEVWRAARRYGAILGFEVLHRLLELLYFKSELFSLFLKLFYPRLKDRVFYLLQRILVLLVVVQHLLFVRAFVPQLIKAYSQILAPLLLQLKLVLQHLYFFSHLAVLFRQGFVLFCQLLGICLMLLNLVSEVANVSRLLLQ